MNTLGSPTERVVRWYGKAQADLGNWVSVEKGTRTYLELQANHVRNFCYKRQLKVNAEIRNEYAGLDTRTHCELYLKCTDNLAPIDVKATIASLPPEQKQFPSFPSWANSSKGPVARWWKRAQEADGQWVKVETAVCHSYANASQRRLLAFSKENGDCLEAEVHEVSEETNEYDLFVRKTSTASVKIRKAKEATYNAVAVANDIIDRTQNGAHRGKPRKLNLVEQAERMDGTLSKAAARLEELIKQKAILEKELYEVRMIILDRMGDI